MSVCDAFDGVDDAFDGMFDVVFDKLFDAMFGPNTAGALTEDEDEDEEADEDEDEEEVEGASDFSLLFFVGAANNAATVVS